MMIQEQQGKGIGRHKDNRAEFAKIFSGHPFSSIKKHINLFI